MMAPFLLPLLAATSLVATQTEAVPGDYVGVWPEEPADRRAWHDLATGMIRAFWGEIPEGAPTPRLMVSPTFVDNGHLCGSYTHELPDANYEVVAVYILRVEPGETVDLPRATVPKITVIDRTADASALDQACPNMPENLRTEVLEPNLPLPPFPDFDSDAVELPQLGPGSVILHSLDRIWPEAPEGTYHLDVATPSIRDGDHFCGQYRLLSPQQQTRSVHWFLARIDAFERRHERTNTLPMTLVNADASPDEVSAWCPRLAESGEFETLMAPQNLSAPAKHISSVERALRPALDDAITARLSQEAGITHQLGPIMVLPNSAQRICGWAILRLTSDHASQSQLAYTARIEADRIPPDAHDPFPTWNVEMVDLSLTETPEALRQLCPSLDRPLPDGYAYYSGDVDQALTLDAAITVHRDGEDVCYFWDSDPHQLHLEDVESGFARTVPYPKHHLLPECRSRTEEEGWRSTNALRAMGGLPPLERPDTSQSPRSPQ
jgi:hypothetical protein